MGNYKDTNKFEKKFTMPTNRTFTMIKPDAVADGHSGAIIQQIESAGYKIVAIKKVHLTKEQAGQFYAIHKDRPFFESLCNYMTSNVIIPMVLEKGNAVQDFRTFIGSTNPELAEAGTIRKQFAKSMEANAIHGSDSDENAEIEGKFFFSEKELEQRL